jgi:hypothetical protein
VRFVGCTNPVTINLAFACTAGDREEIRWKEV